MSYLTIPQCPAHCRFARESVYAYTSRKVKRQRRTPNRPFPPLISGTLCQECPRRADCAFADLGPPADTSLSLIWTQYHAGQHVIDQGEPTTGLHFVCKGVVLVTTLNETGRETVLHPLGVAGILDAPDNLLDKPSYSISAKTLAESTVGFIKLDSLRQLLDTDPSRSAKLLGQVTRQMHNLEERYSQLQSHDVLNRVIHSLLELARICELEPGKQTVLPFSLKRSLLAQMVGTTQETISRVMASLRKNRLVLRSGQQITIPDTHKLREALSRRTSGRRREIQGT